MLHDPETLRAVPRRAGSTFDGAFLLNPPRPGEAGEPGRGHRPTGRSGATNRAGDPDAVPAVDPGVALPGLVGLVAGLSAGRMVAGLAPVGGTAADRAPVAVVLAVLLAVSATLIVGPGARRAATALLWAFLIGFSPVPALAIGILVGLLIFSG